MARDLDTIESWSCLKSFEERRASKDTSTSFDFSSPSGWSSVINYGGLRGCAPPPFVLNTFEMVEDQETDSLISWSSNRTSFVIWDHNKFAAELLPKHFRHSHLSSFIYQLRNYGFRKVSSVRHEYENEWFRPGKKHWLKNIKSRVQKLKMGPIVIDLEKGEVEAEMEKLRAEQRALRVDIQKLKEQQESIEKELAEVQAMVKIDDGDEESIISSFSLELARSVKDKLKRRKSGESSSSSSKKQKGEEDEGEEPRTEPVEGKAEENATNGENSEFWKRIFGCESDEGEQPLQDSKIAMQVDNDMMMMMISKIAKDGEKF